MQYADSIIEMPDWNARTVLKANSRQAFPKENLWSQKSDGAAKRLRAALADPLLHRQNGDNDGSGGNGRMVERFRVMDSIIAPRVADSTSGVRSENRNGKQEKL